MNPMVFLTAAQGTDGFVSSLAWRGACDELRHACMMGCRCVKNSVEQRLLFVFLPCRQARSISCCVAKQQQQQ